MADKEIQKEIAFFIIPGGVVVKRSRFLFFAPPNKKKRPKKDVFCKYAPLFAPLFYKWLIFSEGCGGGGV